MLSDVQDSQGNKMINEYVRERKIGTGSYGKVVSNFLWRPSPCHNVNILVMSQNSIACVRAI